MKTVFIAAFILCETAVVHAATQQGIDMNNLSETKIAMADISKPDSAGKSFIAATVINAPLQKLCSVVQDFSDYPSFMPNTEKAKVSQSAAGYSLVDMTLKLPMGKIKKYRLKMEPKTSPQSCRLSWKLVPWEGLKPEETIVDTSGYWQFTPSPSNANKTVVKYMVYTDPGAIPVGFGWIVDSLSKDSIPKTLEALRAKVAQH